MNAKYVAHSLITVSKVARGKWKQRFRHDWVHEIGSLCKATNFYGTYIMYWCTVQAYKVLPNDSCMPTTPLNSSTLHDMIVDVKRLHLLTARSEDDGRKR